MKRPLLVLGLLLATSGAGWALEFDVVSSTNADLSSSAESMALATRLDGGVLLPFDLRGGGLEVRGHVQQAIVPSPMTTMADVDLATITFAYQKPTDDLKTLTWTMGRFAVSEPTGFILNHTADGSRLSFDYGWADLTVTAAYTGFVTRAASGVALTLADQSAMEEVWASPRFVGQVEGSFSLLKAHRVTVSALAQQDMNSRERLTPEWSNVFTGDQGGTLDTQYLTLKVDGPLADKLYYEAFGTFGAGSTLSWLQSDASRTGFAYEYKPIVAYLSGAAVHYSLRQFGGLSVDVRVVAASGDPDLSSPVEGNTEEASNAFVPITPGSLGIVFSPALSNLINYEVAVTATPLDVVPLTLGAKVLGFQRSVEGVVVAPGVLRKGPLWLGQELDLTAFWQPFSDLTLSCAAGAFVPSADTYTPGTPEAGLQYAIKTGFTLSL